MAMYEPTPEERKEFYHIIACLYNSKKLGIVRTFSFLKDSLARLQSQTSTPAKVLMIGRLQAIILVYEDYLSNRNRDKGMVTIDVSIFDEKMLELPSLLNNLESQTRIAIPDNEPVYKFLYFTDRLAFRAGTEDAKIITLDTWLKRLAMRTEIPLVLAQATAWVNDIKLKSSTKLGGKGTVRTDIGKVSAIKDAAFSAMRVNLGELIAEYPDDIREINKCYDTNLLKPDKSDPDRYLSNQFPMILEAGKITTSIDGTYVPKGSVVTDNRKNKSGVWTWLSMTKPTEKPDYAKFTAAETSEENAVPVLGPKYAKYYNAMFEDPLAEGKLKITVKKRK